MNIVVINGSPKGKGGLTWWALSRFIRGMEGRDGTNISVIQLAGKKIHHCTGEFSCWFKTPGKCIHADDVEELLPALQAADGIVVGTPVYVDGMTGLLKNLLDRTVPLADPHFRIARDGHFRHESRSGRYSSRIALVSVCGFPEIDNFDSLVTHMKAICKNLHAEFAGAILRPAAPIIPILTYLHPLRVRAVSKAIERGGREFIETGTISAQTAQEAAAEIVSPKKYLEMTNTHFDKALRKIG